MSGLSVPTTSALPSSQLIPSSHPAVIKTLSRLSRPSLLSLALDWLDERNQENTAPYLREEDNEDEDDLYPPASSLASLRELYTDLQARKGSKRDVLDRILEGDWADGISLYQLAMADMQYLYDHPSSQKWTALKIVRLASDEPSNPKTKSIPRFHPSTFLRNLQREVLPDVKAHYNLDRHPTLPLLLLRIFIIESPYNTSLALSTGQAKAKNDAATFDASKTFYIAFPDSSPYVYVSLNTTSGQAVSRSDNQSLRRLTLEGIPKAFSRPRERYKLESTGLSARNLDALVERRGGGRSNAAGGGWGVYAEKEKKGGDNPLNIQVVRKEENEDVDELHESQESTPKGLKRKRKEDDGVVKRRRMLAKGRFGNTALPDDGLGIDRFDVRIEDLFPTSSHDEALEADELELDLGVQKKKASRRSTISAELDRRDDKDVEGEGWRPDIRFTFHGQHVFAGIRELVEAGIVDGEKMSGWMTGEEGVSAGVVRDGRIKGFKGSRV
jgi:central kinetochore subunit Mis15/CHL4